MKLKMILLSSYLFSLPVLTAPKFSVAMDSSLKECSQKAVSTLESVDCYSVTEQA